MTGDPIDPERLRSYEVPGAPDGFASRVMAAIDGVDVPTRVPASTTRWTHGRGALAAAFALALVLTVALVAVIARRPRAGAADVVAGATTGGRMTSARESISIGTRGIAVAEAATELRWTVDDRGAAIVEQADGSAFYRVERGGAFEVRTPLGVVRVTGTCFSVEIDMRRPNKDVMKGAALGAALATAVVVVVYEGSVSFARDGREVRAGAGESVVATAGDPPQLRAAGDMQQVAALRARVNLLERELAASGRASTNAPPRAGDPTRFYAPSQDALREMADNCEVAYDLPPFGGDHDELVGASAASSVGLSDDERAKVNAAYAAIESQDVAEMRGLYVELTGADADAAAALSVSALEQDIISKSGPGDEPAARQRYSRERAGLDPAPSPAELATRPPIERMLHIEVELGDRAEAAAAGIVGVERAHALRVHDDGTGWDHSSHSHSGCSPARSSGKP